MKRFFLLLISLIGLCIVFTSCSEDEETVAPIPIDTINMNIFVVAKTCNNQNDCFASNAFLKIYQESADGELLFSDYISAGIDTIKVKDIKSGNYHFTLSKQNYSDISQTIEYKDVIIAKNNNTPLEFIFYDKFFRIAESHFFAEAIISTQEFFEWNNGTIFSDPAKITAFTQKIYSEFNDDFDFIFFISNNNEIPIEATYNSKLIQTKNEIQGVGLEQFDYSLDYGSTGKLKAMIHLLQKNGIQKGPSLHELCHIWANHGLDTYGSTDGMSSTNNKPHWGFTGCGGGFGGQLGGFNENSIQDIGAGMFLVDKFGQNENNGNSVPYSELELYLMGMLDKSKVVDFSIFSNISFDRNTFYETFQFSGTRNKTSIEDFIASNGARIPDISTSQKEFKVLSIVLSTNKLSAIDEQEISNYIEKFSIKDSDGYLEYYNFYEATKGIGSLDMGNLLSSQKETKTKVSNSNKLPKIISPKCTVNNN